MPTKRSADAKKPAARADKPAAASKPDAASNPDAALKIAAAPRKVTTWVAGVDGLSMGIAGAAIVAAGLLVAAYRPSHPAEASTETAATTEAASAATAGAPDANPAAASGTRSTGETASSRDSWQPTPLTIIGCLQRDADAFRLTDTAGIGAPKSRSWKSGFLKKNASSVTVVDSDRRAHLQDHLGHRVSVTGTMVNKEIQIGTLKLVSDSCAEKTKI